jgi:hypothetical protein
MGKKLEKKINGRKGIKKGNQGGKDGKEVFQQGGNHFVGEHFWLQHLAICAKPGHHVVPLVLSLSAIPRV